MGIMVNSLLGVLQDLHHQPYEEEAFSGAPSQTLKLAMKRQTAKPNNCQFHSLWVLVIVIV